MPLSANNNTVPKFWDLAFRISNVTFMLVFTFLLCGIVWLSMGDNIENKCAQWQTPSPSIIVCSVSLIGMSLLGLLANDPKKPYLLSLFLFLLLVIMIVLIIIVIFIYIVTAKGAGKKYNIGDYSPWMQKRISN